MMSDMAVVVIKIVSKLLKIYDLLLERLLIFLFSSMIILMFSEVIARHVLNRPIIWSEELGRMLFIWCVFLGAALAFLRKNHITIDYFTNFIPSNLIGPISIAIDILVMGTLIFVFILGTKYAAANFNTPAYSIPVINLGWAYMAVPVGALTMAVNLLRTIFSDETKG